MLIPSIIETRRLRMLGDDSVKTKTEDDVYKAFYVMAQIGGFYSFLSLLYRSVFSIFSFNMLMVSVINKYNERNSKTSKSFKMKRYASMGVKSINPGKFR